MIGCSIRLPDEQTLAFTQASCRPTASKTILNLAKNPVVDWEIYNKHLETWERRHAYPPLGKPHFWFHSFQQVTEQFPIDRRTPRERRSGRRNWRRRGLIVCRVLLHLQSLVATTIKSGKSVNDFLTHGGRFHVFQGQQLMMSWLWSDASVVVS